MEDQWANADNVLQKQIKKEQFLLIYKWFSLPQ